MKRRVLLLAVLAGLLAFWLWPAERSPILELERVIVPPIEHPSHVLKLHGEFVATELFSERLAFSREIEFQTPRMLDPRSFQERLQSPHFLAASATGGYLVSEGWGKGVVAMSDSKGGGWRRFQGNGELQLDLPHGLCLDSQGWIHVADSMNSRLVRFKAAEDEQWQLFPDHARLVGYGRQILCREDGVWLTSSYGPKPGLNPGTGSKVLRIVDFESGRADVVLAFPDVYATGLEIIDDRWLVVGLWSPNLPLQVLDLTTGHGHQLERASPELGAPYGMYFDEAERRLIVAHIGDLRGRSHPGGIAVYRASS